jgi:hypothetical protein
VPTTDGKLLAAEWDLVRHVLVADINCSLPAVDGVIHGRFKPVNCRHIAIEVLMA